MGATAQVRVRRVGFRDGTDAELAAMHAVESVIEAERRPDRAPQPLDAYVAFARNLPSQFDDHTWLAETPDGTPIATAACWSNAHGDRNVMDCDVLVLPEHRRLGIGSTLLRAICEVALAEERGLLVWGTFDHVVASVAFSRAVGGRVGSVHRGSALQLAEVDWTMVARWIETARGRALGYTLDAVDGPFPPELHADAVTFHHIMQTAPRDDLEASGVFIGVDDVVEIDRALVESGRQRWAILVRSPDGACVGGTEVELEPWDPAVVLQGDTGIDPAHRGLGLAKWVKAVMLQRIRDELPHATWVRTGNAFSNAPMLAINDALGFEVYTSRTGWQAETRHVLAALSHPPRTV